MQVEHFQRSLDKNRLPKQTKHSEACLIFNALRVTVREVRHCAPDWSLTVPLFILLQMLLQCDTLVWHRLWCSLDAVIWPSSMNVLHPQKRPNKQLGHCMLTNIIQDPYLPIPTLGLFRINWWLFPCGMFPGHPSRYQKLNLAELSHMKSLHKKLVQQCGTTSIQHLKANTCQSDHFSMLICYI